MTATIIVDYNTKLTLSDEYTRGTGKVELTVSRVTAETGQTLSDTLTVDAHELYHLVDLFDGRSV